ncbi:hypothetical protein AVEN_31644-1 [Araneus ventricosus]|uniref:Uncharacterized protein n=1 Tax=Araneus ventricosus TaxID=182803 RepID=A0A4Y2L7U8_ARAVE|nr:hypothetical protein AVEN_31644-1 [Araneus ventricosus]
MNENLNIFITTKRVLCNLHQKRQHAAQQLQHQRHQKAACPGASITPLSESLLKIPTRSKIMIDALDIPNILAIRISLESRLGVEEAKGIFSVVFEVILLAVSLKQDFVEFAMTCSLSSINIID